MEQLDLKANFPSTRLLLRPIDTLRLRGYKYEEILTKLGQSKFPEVKNVTMIGLGSGPHTDIFTLFWKNKIWKDGFLEPQKREIKRLFGLENDVEACRDNYHVRLLSKYMTFQDWKDGRVLNDSGCDRKKAKTDDKLTLLVEKYRKMKYMDSLMGIRWWKGTLILTFSHLDDAKAFCDPGRVKFEGTLWYTFAHDKRWEPIFCFRCSGAGHFQDSCPSEKKKCGHCAKEDEHVSKECESSHVECPNCHLKHKAWSTACQDSTTLDMRDKMSRAEVSWYPGGPRLDTWYWRDENLIHLKSLEASERHKVPKRDKAEGKKRNRWRTNKRFARSSEHGQQQLENGSQQDANASAQPDSEPRSQQVPPPRFRLPTGAHPSSARVMEDWLVPPTSNNATPPRGGVNSPISITSSDPNPPTPSSIAWSLSTGTGTPRRPAPGPQTEAQLGLTPDQNGQPSRNRASSDPNEWSLPSTIERQAAAPSRLVSGPRVGATSPSPAQGSRIETPSRLALAQHATIPSSRTLPDINEQITSSLRRMSSAGPSQRSQPVSARSPRRQQPQSPVASSSSGTGKSMAAAAAIAASASASAASSASATSAATAATAATTAPPSPNFTKKRATAKRAYDVATGSPASRMTRETGRPATRSRLHGPDEPSLLSGSIETTSMDVESVADDHSGDGASGKMPVKRGRGRPPKSGFRADEKCWEKIGVKNSSGGGEKVGVTNQRGGSTKTITYPSERRARYARASCP